MSKRVVDLELERADSALTVLINSGNLGSKDQVLVEKARNALQKARSTISDIRRNMQEAVDQL